MAKLSAYGQYELARFERAGNVDNRVTSWERVTFVVMSNGRVLRKLDVTFRSDGRRHSYGWKVVRSADRPGVEKVARLLLAKGFTAIPHRGRYGEQTAYKLP